MRWTPSSLTHQRPRLVSHTRSPLGLFTHTGAHSHSLAHSYTHLLAHGHPPPCCTHSHTHAHTVLCVKCTLSLLIINTLARYSNHSKIKYRYVGDEEKVHVDLWPAGGPWPLRGKRREHGPLGVPRPGGATVPSFLPGLGPKSSSHRPPQGQDPGPKTELTKKINSSSHSRAPDAGMGAPGLSGRGSAGVTAAPGPASPRHCHGGLGGRGAEPRGMRAEAWGGQCWRSRGHIRVGLGSVAGCGHAGGLRGPRQP